MYVEYNSSTFCRKTCIKIAATAAKCTRIHTHYIFNDGWYVRLSVSVSSETLTTYVRPQSLVVKYPAQHHSVCSCSSKLWVKALYHWVYLLRLASEMALCHHPLQQCQKKQSIKLCLNDLKHLCGAAYTSGFTSLQSLSYLWGKTCYSQLAFNEEPTDRTWSDLSVRWILDLSLL